jgi:hypothetical protein
MREPLLLAIAIGSTVLTLGLGNEVFKVIRADPYSPSLSGLERSPPSSAADPFPELPSQNWSREDILFRPLFMPNRRPYAAPESAEPPPDTEPEMDQPASLPPPPSFTLKGVLLTEGSSMALISSPDEAHPAWLAPGSVLQGWRILRVEQNSVDLIAGTEVTTIKLYVDNRTD